MKTIAFALSVLTTSIFTANANDLAAFLEYTKTYTVSFSDGVSYDRVTFKRFAKGSNAAEISHPTNGTLWINLDQVIRVFESKPADDARENSAESTEAKDSASGEKISEPDIEVEESPEAVFDSLVQPEDSGEHQGGGLEGAALGGLVGGEAGAAIGFLQKPDHVIQGAWEFLTDDTTRAIKIIGDGRWSLTHFDRDSGEVKINHGGSYTFDGKRYVEHVEYANESTGNLVGEKHTFELTIEGDVIHQKGIENPWTEEWVKVKQ